MSHIFSLSQIHNFETMIVNYTYIIIIHLIRVVVWTQRLIRSRFKICILCEKKSYICISNYIKKKLLNNIHIGFRRVTKVIISKKKNILNSKHKFMNYVQILQAIRQHNKERKKKSKIKSN